MITVERSVTIERPGREVAAQFADVAHHEANRVHRGVRFTVVEEAPEECRYQQSVRITGRELVQTMHLDRRAARHLVNTVMEGPFRGGTLVFDIQDESPTSTAVTARLQAPTTMVTKIFAPVLRTALGRDLAKALMEDKRDLESGAYGRDTARTESG